MEKKVPNITKKQLIPFIRKAYKGVAAFLVRQSQELGPLYNKKNVYEELSRRFCDPYKEPEKFFDEYMLCLNKASRQPSSIRNVILEIGGHAVNLFLAKREERLHKRKLQIEEKGK